MSGETYATSSPPGTASKPSTRPRKTAYRRPRTFPNSVRQKLSQLGHAAPTNDTSRENMAYLIDRLSADLSNYKILAEHWQKKVMELQPADSPSTTSENSKETSTSMSEEVAQIASSPSLSDDELSSFGTHMVRKLDSVANPSLSVIAMGAPNVHSDVSSLVTASTFQVIILAMDHTAALQHTIHTSDNPFPNIYHFKPDFDAQKARKTWDDIFTPMSFHPSQAHFNAGSSCRRTIAYDIEDDDSDHFDKALTQASDFDLVDMMHYITLLISGMHQAVFDDPSLNAARIHLGKACERVLREVIFTRNLTSNHELALGVLDGICGSFSHFGPQGQTGAMLSLLELGWSILSALPKDISLMHSAHLNFLSLVLATNDSKRAHWLKHIDALLEANETIRSYATFLWCYFGRAYNALLTHDEDTFLHNASLLDDMSRENPMNHGRIEVWDFVVRSLTPGPEPIRPLPTVVTYSMEPNTLLEHDSSHVSPSYDTSSFGNASRTDQIYDPWFSANYVPGPESTIGLHSETHDTSDAYLDDHGKPYVPGENLKAIYRISVQVMRAEASLIFHDHESCMHWVDEAEKTMLAVPLTYMFQKVFLLKNVIKHTCPFPTGTRSVVDEFERRMLAHDDAAASQPSPQRTYAGVLWRTP